MDSQEYEAMKRVFLGTSLSDNHHNNGSNRVQPVPPESLLFGQSAVMGEIRRKVEKLASARVPILIEGESGTGKEMMARWIHSRSLWKSGSFVKVNCAAIPGSLLESELYGYEKGAFTGAYERKPGRMELAHGGTLFLDEVTEIDHSLQAKLLQSMQDNRFCRIGGTEEQQVETRVICATNRNLEQEMEKGNFRVDLFHRINVIRIRMPRLRDRRDDLVMLAEYFLSTYGARFERTAPPFPDKLMRFWLASDWPGNIRELENRVARYVLLGEEDIAISKNVPRRIGPESSGAPTGDPISLKRMTKQACLELGREVILRALQSNHWNRRRAAEELKISYRALLYKIREAGLPSKRGHGHSMETPKTGASRNQPAE